MTLHEQSQALIDAVAEQDEPGWHERSPAEGRAVFAGMQDLMGEAPAVARVHDIEASGIPKIRIYAAQEQTTNQPVVMYFHGGGWVLGDLETHDALCRQLAVETGFAIASVEYGLAPENKFPGPLEDCFAAVKYVSSNAEALGVDPGKIAVVGDSAGGNLAAAVAMKARDDGGPPIKFQLLIYPVIERDFESESYQKFGAGHVLTTDNMKWFWQQYLKDDGDAANPLAAPSKADSLAGLPPAHVTTLLAEAGVAATHKEYPGMLHGFVHFRGVFDDGAVAVTDIAKQLKQHLSSEAPDDQ